MSRRFIPGDVVRIRRGILRGATGRVVEIGSIAHVEVLAHAAVELERRYPVGSRWWFDTDALESGSMDYVSLLAGILTPEGA